MSFAKQLEELQKVANVKQQNPKEATSAFKKFQLELIRHGHKQNSPQDLKAASLVCVYCTFIILALINIVYIDKWKD